MRKAKLVKSMDEEWRGILFKTISKNLLDNQRFNKNFLQVLTLQR
jgi:hypothetical protein